MPCRSDYMEPSKPELEESAELRKQFEALGNEATADADMLREYVLGNLAAERILDRINKPHSEKYVSLRKLNDKLYVKVPAEITTKVNMLISAYETADALAHDKAKGKPVSDEVLADVEKVQIEHREADLRRLMRTFADSGDRVRLKKVLDADNSKPLAAQLGFDPDEF
jgi:hypothetical protein